MDYPKLQDNSCGGVKVQGDASKGHGHNEKENGTNTAKSRRIDVVTGCLGAHVAQHRRSPSHRFP